VLTVLLGLGGVLALLYLIAWLAIGRGAGHPPAILGDQQVRMVGRPVDDPAWTATLQRNFPRGVGEAHLVSVLQAQGFRIDRGKRIAVYAWQEPFCRITLMVNWTAADRRIETVKGGSAGMCL